MSQKRRKIRNQQRDVPVVTARRGRNAFLILLAVLFIVGILTIWQWSVSNSHKQAVQQLAMAMDSGSKGVGPELSLDDADGLLNPTMKIGPFPHAGKSMVVHVWRGPFRNHQIRVLFDTDGHVSAYDTNSTIPDAEPQNDSSAEAAKLIEDKTPKAQPPGAHSQIPQTANTSTLHPNPNRTLSPSALKNLADIENIINAAVIPEPSGPGRAANRKVKAMLENELDDPFELNNETIIESEYVQRRIEWYRRQWPETFRQHSRKDPRWADLAENFLTLAADAVGTYGSIDRNRAAPFVTELEEADCDDPLIQSLIYGYLRNDPMPEELKDAFFDCDYSANALWLTAFPSMDARDLLRLQAVRTPDGNDPEHNLLDIEDPLEMRIVFEQFARHRRDVQFGDLDFDKRTDLPMVLATQKVSPWLGHMLLGEVKWAQRNHTAATDCYRNAWYVLPTNPEGPASMFNLQVTNFWNTHNPQIMKEADLWFFLTVQAQYDYPPAWGTHLGWTYGRNGADYDRLMGYARQCLNTKRFDTDVPMEFLRVVRHLRRCANRDRHLPGRIRSQEHFSEPAVYAGLQELVDGYTTSPHLRELKSFLICSAYLTGHIQEAVSMLTEPGMELHKEAARACQVTPQEIRRAAAMSQDLPKFRPCVQQNVSGLGFADGGSMLLCLTGDGRVCRVNASSGVVESTTSADDKIEFISNSVHGSSFLAWDPENKVTLRDVKTTAIIRKVILREGVSGIFGTSDTTGYWYTCHSNDNEDGLILTRHSLADETAGPTFATSYHDIDRVDIAAVDHRLAALGREPNSTNGRSEVRVTVWDQSSGNELLNAQPFSTSTERIALSGDGKLLAVAGSDRNDRLDPGLVWYRESSVRILDIDSGRTVAQLDHPGEISRLLFLKERGVLATACVDGIIRLWNPVTGEMISKLVAHNRMPCSLCWLPEKDLLASSDTEGQIRLWTIDDSPIQLQITLDSRALVSLTKLNVDPLTQDILTVSREAGTLRWHAATNYQTHEQFTAEMTQFARDGTGFVIVSPSVKPDDGQVTRAVEIQNLETGQKIQTLNVPSTGFVKAIVTPDGKSVVTSGNVATVWNLETGKPWPWGLLTGHRGAVSVISISADGRRLATTCRLPKPEVRIWELPADFNAPDARPQLLFDDQPRVNLSFHDGAILSPNGEDFLLAQSDNEFQIRAASSGLLRGMLHGEDPSFSPDGTRLLIYDDQDNIIVYNANSLQPEKSFSSWCGSPGFLQWGSDSQTFFYAVNGWISHINIDSGEDLIHPNNYSVSR